MTEYGTWLKSTMPLKKGWYGQIGKHWDNMPHGTIVFLKLQRPLIDLFATSLNHQIPTYVSLVPDPIAWAVDALTLPWEGLFAYAFLPIALITRVIQKIQESKCLVVLIAPWWPRQSWFPELLELLVDHPLILPSRRNLLTQPHIRMPHSNPDILKLAAWKLSI